MSKERRELPKFAWRLSTTPSVNPRYKGATPADMARILLGKRLIRHTPKVGEKSPAVETGI